MTSKDHLNDLISNAYEESGLAKLAKVFAEEQKNQQNLVRESEECGDMKRAAFRRKLFHIKDRND